MKFFFNFTRNFIKHYILGIYDSHIRENYSGLKMKKELDNCTGYLSDFRNNKINQELARIRLSKENEEICEDEEERDNADDSDSDK